MPHGEDVPRVRVAAWNTGWVDDHNSAVASGASRVAGSLYSVIAPAPKVAPRTGEFNHSRLVVQSGVVEHWLNGTRVVRYEIAATRPLDVRFTGWRRRSRPARRTLPSRFWG
jgi:hypothetical protein